MCEYCEKSIYVGDFECIYDKGEFGVWIDRDNMNMGVCYGEEEIEIPIDFCPICGRKIGF